MFGRKLKGLRGLPFRLKYRSGCILITLVVVLILLFSSGPWLWGPNDPSTPRQKRTIHPVRWNETDQSLKTSCYFHSCFEINQCVLGGDKERIRVYVHQPVEFVSSRSSQTYSPESSQEYEEMLMAIRGSRYHESNMSRACVFVPSVDTLNQGNLEVKLTSILLNSLPSWNNGQNYLIFSMIPGALPHFNTTPDFYYGKSIIAGGSFSPTSYRHGFDVSIPVFNSLTREEIPTTLPDKRSHLLTLIVHGHLSQELREQLKSLSLRDVLTVETACSSLSIHELPWKRCSSLTGEVYIYLEVLKRSNFCLLVSSTRHGSSDFTDMLMMGCIPVIIGDDYVLPFSEVLDWNRATVTCWSHDISEIVSRLSALSTTRVQEMRQQGLFFYRQYFSSMASIAMTTLDIINERVFPTSKLGYEHWNNEQQTRLLGSSLEMLTATPDEGFTAIILTYNRVRSLFEAIKSVAKAPSLSKIIVVWNNVNVQPPSVEEWPRIKKPIQVIRSKKNKLSNRFYPYPEITTAAVFSLDDDITMLTADELEFGFKAWKQFPNRLVGFPGRVHIDLSSTEDKKLLGRWKYESSWLNNISLVLTGASFYHKYFHYLYTHVMPSDIRQWVDSHMNCEDIAMNFLVANHTGLPPLKVSPRKKFTCPSCSSDDSLWNDPEHYLERDECVNIFERFFKGMPLTAVKFRLDPLLYKEPVEEQLMSYPNMGEL